MFYRAILSRWEVESENYDRQAKPASLGDYELEEEQIVELNSLGYNIYFFPNHPSQPLDKFTEAQDVDVFNFVFVDMDLKDKVYASKQEFIEKLASYPLKPTSIVDSGNGIHAYWRVVDLDAMSFLRLQRRLCRHLRTDQAVAKLNQLMRVPGTLNTKAEDRAQWKPCEIVSSEDLEYTCEQLDKATDKITDKDEEYCQRTYDSAYNPNKAAEEIEDLPRRWFKFASKGSEAYKLFYGTPKDRSKADFRLGHLMAADGFTKEEALAVLANTAKASERTVSHRYNYASNIVDQVWDQIQDVKKPTKDRKLGYTVGELLFDDEDHDEFEGTPFPCHDFFDATVCGFRLGHVIGLVGGSGSGKTAISLNMFYQFVKNNPEYVHVVFTLEQPKKEIAKRWKKISGGNKAFYGNVIIVDNYNDDGTYRNLGLDDCEEFVRELQEAGTKVGAVMVDHIGVLKKENKNGEREGLIDICTKMKAFAVTLNILLIMQSQTSREKAKGGDIELNKDAAYGTANFEWFVDWLMTIWQPLKKLYSEAPHMTVTCFKYCKIRHKHPEDNMKEDTVYALKFDPATEQLRRLNAVDKQSYDFYAKRADAARKRDPSADSAPVSDVTWSKESADAK